MLFGKILASLSSTLIGQKPEELRWKSSRIPLDFWWISTRWIYDFPAKDLRILAPQILECVFSYFLFFFYKFPVAVLVIQNILNTEKDLHCFIPCREILVILTLDKKLIKNTNICLPGAFLKFKKIQSLIILFY